MASAPFLNAAEALLEPALELGLAGAPAVVGPDRTLTYADLRDEAFRTAQALAGLGIRPGERVVLLLRDSPEWVAAYLGILAAGTVAVTVNLRSSDAELAHVLRDSECALVLLEAEFSPLWQRLRASGANCPAYTVRGTVPGLPAWEPRVAQAKPEFTPVRQPEDAMAFWIYTSGTTGEMKACVHRQRDVLLGDAYLRDILGVRPGMRLFATSKLFFAYALGTCLFGALRLGATAILLDVWPTPVAVEVLLERHRPHIVFSVPAFYRALLRSGAAGHRAFRGVQTWVSAGERLPVPVYERWRETVGSAIVEGMGTSETVFMILTQRPCATAPGSSGRPAPGVQARLLDPAGHAVTTPGQPGMLAVRTESTLSTYWNQPERTAAVLREGWLVTGDVFTVDPQGNWHHGGRAEDRIAAGTGSINPADIEERLHELPGVADACIVATGAPDALSVTVCAVPTPNADMPALAMAIRAEVARWLPPPLPPAQVRWLPDLPRTASGKVQRYRLRV